MRTLKVIAGMAFLLAALLLGLIVFFNFKFPLDLTFGIGSLWLSCIGIFLIARRNLPMLGKTKVRLILNFCLCIGVIVFAGLPSFIKARSTAAVNACLNNLGQIDAAANQFALEHHLTNGAPINFPSDLTPYIKLNSAGKIPACPSGGIYHLSKVGETPTCSLGTTVTPAHVCQ